MIFAKLGNLMVFEVAVFNCDVRIPKFKLADSVRRMEIWKIIGFL